ncbi:unnamed protein product [Larinioides sclopetarius]|uniref:Uncharacterized protein n=1 Tax=Larinioides sclopetarius TaxID=280406 RepID=A0AAV2BST1_9ARAC
MLSSHEMYLTFVMFACISERACSENIFESFTSVCALVELLCDETLEKTGVNFCDLKPKIIEMFYHLELKEVFCRPHLGFQRFAEFIRSHRYLRWKLNKNYSASSDGPTDAINSIQRFDEKIKKELRRDRVIEKEINPDEVARDKTSRYFAEAVLRFIKIKLPTLPSYQDVLKSVIAHKKNEKAKPIEEKRGIEAAETLENINESLHGGSSPNSELKSNYNPKHEDTIERYEKIIQAVIRYNHSKSSSNENASNRNQKEADEVLKHLKEKIESLTEVLDKCGGE